MKLNNKGFAITAILYGILILFVFLVGSYFLVLSSKKNRLDNIIKGIETKHTVKIIAYDIKNYTNSSDDLILDNAFMFDENNQRHVNQSFFEVHNDTPLEIKNLNPTDVATDGWALFNDPDCGFYPIECGTELDHDLYNNEISYHISYVKNVGQDQHDIVDITLTNIKRNMVCRIYFTNDEDYWRDELSGCNRLN